MKTTGSACALLTVVCGLTGRSCAIVINLMHVDAGQAFAPWAPDAADTGSRSAATIPGPVGGDYTLQNVRLDDIMQCAAGWWESAIHDDHTVNIRYGWSLPVAAGGGPGSISDTAKADERTNAATRDVTTSPGHARAVDTVIRFNSNAVVDWWMDDNPPTSRAQFLNPAGFPGGVNFNPGLENDGNIRDPGSVAGPLDVNVARVAFATPGPAAGLADLFTTALHEIGHALGMDPGTMAPGPTGITLTGARAAACGGETDLLLPTLGGDNGLHLTLTNSLMAPGRPSGTRMIMSAADVLAVSELSGWTDFSLQPLGPAPAPGTLAVVGVGGLVCARRRR